MRKVLYSLCAVIVALSVASVARAADPPDPSMRNWQNQMSQLKRPVAKGCFATRYPSTDWTAVACVATPKVPMPPKDGARPLVVGNGSDVSARVPGGTHIQTAIGSFDNVVNVTSGSGPIGNSGPSINNAYTLQMNT